VKADGSGDGATMLELSQPIARPNGKRTLPERRVILTENRYSETDIAKQDGDKGDH
jgi:hypothetical protein